MPRRALTLTALLVLGLLAPGSAAAQVGVGVNVGRISVDEVLSPGGSYTLPRIGVINTGGQASEYSVRVTYRADQEQERPPQSWFSFHPEVFRLEPGESQSVMPRVHVPPTARPGEYAALIEAYPVAEDRPGVAIGVAAATRVDFTVRASNPAMGAALWTYHRFDDAAPYSWAAVVLAVLGGLGLLARRYLRLQLRIERR